jgi:hypothetical protein
MNHRASSSQRLLLWIINKVGDLLIKDDRGDSADNRMAVFFTPSGKVSNIQILIEKIKTHGLTRYVVVSKMILL